MEKAASQDKDAEMAVQRATLVLRLREGINSLARVLKVIEVSEFVKKIKEKIESLNDLLFARFYLRYR